MLKQKIDDTGLARGGDIITVPLSPSGKEIVSNDTAQRELLGLIAYPIQKQTGSRHRIGTFVRQYNRTHVWFKTRKLRLALVILERYGIPFELTPLTTNEDMYNMVMDIGYIWDREGYWKRPISTPIPIDDTHIFQRKVFSNVKDKIQMDKIGLFIRTLMSLGLEVEVQVTGYRTIEEESHE